jgi:hypothetical protein
MGTNLNLPSGKKAEFECKSVQHKKSSIFGGTETWFSYEGRITDQEGKSSSFKTLRKANGKWPDDLNSSDEIGDRATLEEFRHEVSRHGL